MANTKRPTPMALLLDSLGFRNKDLARSLSIHPSLVSQAKHGKGLGARVTKLIFDKYRKELTALGLTAEDFLRGRRR